LLVYRRIMPAAERLSSKFHSCPQSFTSRPIVHFSDIFHPWAFSGYDILSSERGSFSNHVQESVASSKALTKKGRKGTLFKCLGFPLSPKANIWICDSVLPWLNWICAQPRKLFSFKHHSVKNKGYSYIIIIRWISEKNLLNSKEWWFTTAVNGRAHSLQFSWTSMLINLISFVTAGTKRRSQVTGHCFNYQYRKYPKHL